MRDDAVTILAGAVLSLADWARPGRARAIGGSLAELGQAAPQRWGRGEPARRRLPDPLPAFLEEWSPRFGTQDSVLFLDGERASIWLESCPATSGGSVPSFLLDRCFNEIGIELDQAWFEEVGGGLDVAASVFTSLCESSDAFYGHLTPSELLAQSMSLRGDGVDAGVIDVPNFGADPKHPYSSESCYVEDVGWLNYFGPAFVARWTRAAFDQVGVRREWTENGGVVVWSCPRPPEYESVDSIGAYEWKRTFYDALDSDAFVHEGFELGAVGERVPTFDEHRAHLRPAEGLK